MTTLTETPSRGETQSLRRRRWKLPNDVEVFLRGRGFRLVGEGFFSKAYAKPGGDKVVKFSYEEDVCYLKFIESAMRLKSDYLPKIHLYRPYTMVDTDLDLEFQMFIIVIERLGPINATNIMRHMKDADMFSWFLVEDVLSYDLLDYNTVREFLGKRLSVRTSSDRLLKQAVRQAAKRFVDSDHELIKTLKQIGVTPGKKGSKHKGCDADIHSGNVMWRKSTKTPVIVDPLA